MSAIYDHPDLREIRAHSPSASIVQMETSKLIPMMVVLALFSGGALMSAVLCWVVMSERVQRAEVETRLLEYYLLELDAKAIAAGIKRPEEAISNRMKERK